MLHRKICAPLIVALVLTAAQAVAQQQEQHHPAGTPPAAAAPGMPGGAMAGVSDMPMMGMMRMMGRNGMADMSMMAEHVEGRLAFLKTELKITEAQLPLWCAVADAIRANAKGMSAMSEGMHTGHCIARQAGAAGKDDDRASRGAAQVQSSG